MNKFNILVLFIVFIVAGSIVSCNRDLPYACIELSTDQIYVDSIVQFNNCSNGADSYLWDFGDSITSIEKSPIHIYHESGQYEVFLEVKSSSKTDYVYHTINVYDTE